jgi:molybdopterin converting factor small subunit
VAETITAQAPHGGATGDVVLLSQVQVRYFASAAEAAGCEEETLSGVTTVGELRALLLERYGAPMGKVLASGSFLVDGVVRRDDDRRLGLRVDVLPPFAGG